MTISDLQGLLEKATALPWASQQCLTYVGIMGGDALEERFGRPTAIGHTTISNGRNRDKATANAALIVAAVNALPALLSRIASDQARMERMRSALEGSADTLEAIAAQWVLGETLDEMLHAAHDDARSALAEMEG